MKSGIIRTVLLIAAILIAGNLYALEGSPWRIIATLAIGALIGIYTAALDDHIERRTVYRRY